MLKSYIVTYYIQHTHTHLLYPTIFRNDEQKKNLVKELISSGNRCFTFYILILRRWLKYITIKQFYIKRFQKLSIPVKKDNFNFWHLNLIDYHSKPIQLCEKRFSDHLSLQYFGV